MDQQRNHDPFGGGVSRIIPGDNVTIDSTDPTAPEVSASGGGGGGGIASVTAGQNILVDSTDPANPVVSVGTAAPFDFGLTLQSGVTVLLASDATTFLELETGVVVLTPDSGSTGLSIAPGLIQLLGATVFNGVFVPAKYSTVSLPDPATSGEGAIAYDTTAHNLVISDGTNWLTVPQPPSAGSYTIGTAGSDVTLLGNTVFIKNADNSAHIALNSLGVGVAGVFAPQHYSTGTLPDPADHPGGIAWDTTTLSLAVSDGTSWKHIAAV